MYSLYIHTENLFIEKTFIYLCGNRQYIMGKINREIFIPWKKRTYEVLIISMVEMKVWQWNLSELGNDYNEFLMPNSCIVSNVLQIFYSLYLLTVFGKSWYAIWKPTTTSFTISKHSKCKSYETTDVSNPISEYNISILFLYYVVWSKIEKLSWRIIASYTHICWWSVWHKFTAVGVPYCYTSDKEP